MKVSVIIPVLNEEKIIGDLIDDLLRKSAGFIQEIIVVDGGSKDSTVQVAKEKGILVIPSSKGRALQMNTGASIAEGEILYFLHADSIVPAEFDQLIVEAVDQGAVSGCFKMRFDSRHWLLRFSGWLTRFNSSWCRGGDQSLFVRKNDFEAVSGFREDLVIYEDNEILVRLRRRGPFQVIRKDLITSSRRYRENGVVRLQFLFLCIHLMYRLGFKQEKMLNFYKKHIR